jgi:lysozyme family protein
MNTFKTDTAEKMLDFIMEREGGFVNNPADPGGATNYGISLRFLKTVDPDLADLDGDGEVDINDILAMTPDIARAFYRQWFYHPMGIDQYPAPLGAAMLDAGVNMGKGTAARLLQQALNQCGADLIEDGIVGLKTRTAVKFFDVMEILHAMLLARVFMYAQLCRRNQNLHHFFFGWVERIRHLYAFCVEISNDGGAA